MYSTLGEYGDVSVDDLSSTGYIYVYSVQRYGYYYRDRLVIEDYYYAVYVGGLFERVRETGLVVDQV